MGGWNAKKWIGEDSSDEPCRRGSDRYKRKPPNDLRSIKKKLRTHTLLFKFKEQNVPVKDEPAA